MNDKFFTQKKCDRCSKELEVRTMSWFTEECICDICSNKEQELKSKLQGQGVNVSDLEGCGYMPQAGKL